MRYKQVFAKYGITQTELAQKMGYQHKQSITNLIVKGDGVHLRTLIKMADAIGCNVAEFFDDWRESAPEHTHSTIQGSRQAIICPHCGKAITIRTESEQ